MSIEVIPQKLIITDGNLSFIDSTSDDLIGELPSGWQVRYNGTKIKQVFDNKARLRAVLIIGGALDGRWYIVPEYKFVVSQVVPHGIIQTFPTPLIIRVYDENYRCVYESDVFTQDMQEASWLKAHTELFYVVYGKNPLADVELFKAVQGAKDTPNVD